MPLDIIILLYQRKLSNNWQKKVETENSPFWHKSLTKSSIKLTKNVLFSSLSSSLILLTIFCLNFSKFSLFFNAIVSKEMSSESEIELQYVNKYNIINSSLLIEEKMNYLHSLDFIK